jgi:hypothetical protein
MLEPQGCWLAVSLCLSVHVRRACEAETHSLQAAAQQQAENLLEHKMRCDAVAAQLEAGVRDAARAAAAAVTLPPHVAQLLPAAQ